MQPTSGRRVEEAEEVREGGEKGEGGEEDVGRDACACVSGTGQAIITVLAHKQAKCLRMQTTWKREGWEKRREGAERTEEEEEEDEAGAGVGAKTGQQN